MPQRNLQQQSEDHISREHMLDRQDMRLLKLNQYNKSPSILDAVSHYMLNSLKQGVVAQLGARFLRKEEAVGSNPIGSTMRAE